MKKTLKSIGYKAIFEGVCDSIGLPGFAAFLLSSTFKVSKTHLTNHSGTIYDDYSRRQLSKLQLNRLDFVTKRSILQFYERIKQDNWCFIQHPESEAYLSALLESQDHLIYRALQEAQRSKDELFGCLWGNLIYDHDENWNDQYYTISLLSRLSFRQLLLLKLINEEFKGIDRTLAVTNPVVSVEIQELYHLGLWDMMGKYINANYNNTQDLTHIKGTKFSRSLYDKLSLKEKNYEKEITDLVQEMQLRPGIPAPYLLYAHPNGNYAEMPSDK